jgi:integrase
MLAKSGVSVYALKELMRHSRISVTEEYYLNIGDELHRKILDNFSKSIE